MVSAFYCRRPLQNSVEAAAASSKLLKPTTTQPHFFSRYSSIVSDGIFGLLVNWVTMMVARRQR